MGVLDICQANKCNEGLLGNKPCIAAFYALGARSGLWLCISSCCQTSCAAAAPTLCTNQRTTFPRNLSLDKMTETVGTTRELVNCILHRFAAEDIIQINCMEFVFMNPEALEELASQ
jgi:hypothetical protein